MGSSTLAGREQAGGGCRGLWVGSGQDWTQAKLFFCHEKENEAFAPWIIYLCVFSPCSNQRTEIKY